MYLYRLPWHEVKTASCYIEQKPRKTTCLPRRRGTRYGDPTDLNHINRVRSLQKQSCILFSCVQMACKQAIEISRGNMTRKLRKKIGRNVYVCRLPRITAYGEQRGKPDCSKVLLKYSNPTRVFSTRVSFFCNCSCDLHHGLS